MKMGKRLSAAVALVLIGAILCTCVSAEIGVEDQDSLLQCSWVPSSDSTGHWEACSNHTDTGEYNGVMHYNGRKTPKVEPHTYKVTQQPTCFHGGIEDCTVCGYRRYTDATPHVSTEPVEWMQAGWEQDMHRCAVCGNWYIDSLCEFVDFSVSPLVTTSMKCIHCGRTYPVMRAPSMCSAAPGAVKLHHFSSARGSKFIDTGDYDGLECDYCHQVIPIKQHECIENVCKSCGKQIFSKPDIEFVSASGKTQTWRLTFHGLNNLSDFSSQILVNGSWDQNGGVGAVKDLGNHVYEVTATKTAYLSTWGPASISLGFSSSDFNGSGCVFINTVFDRTAPKQISATIAPTGQDDTWANRGIINVVGMDTESGKLEAALYDGDTCLVPYRALTQMMMQYRGELVFGGIYPDWLTLTIRLRDYDGNVTETPIEVRHIENAPPDITWELSTSDPTTGPVTVTLHGSDAHSGFNRFRLPDGTFSTSPAISFDALKNGEYYVRAEDNIGNAHTVKITVDNIVEAVSIDVSTTPFTINPNNPPGADTAEGGSVTFRNPNDFPVEVTVDAITAQPGSIPVVPHAEIGAWRELGVTGSAQSIAISLQKDSACVWPSEEPVTFTVPAQSAETWRVVSLNGLCFPADRLICYDLHCTVQF